MISINAGHSYAAPGASGYLDEVEVARATKDRVIEEMRRRGYEISDSTSEASTKSGVLKEQVRLVKASGASLAVSIHLNAGGGTGPEVWHYTGDAWGANVSRITSANLAKALGLRDRGAKSTKDLYFLSSTPCTAVLIELCFVDSEQDAHAWHATSWGDVVGAICDGLEEKAWEGSPAPTAAPACGWVQDEEGWWYRREDGSYPKDQWFKLGDDWYHFDEAGYMQTGWFTDTDGKEYWLEPANDSGRMARSTVLYHDWIDRWYAIGADGACIKGSVPTLPGGGLILK